MVSWLEVESTPPVAPAAAPARARDSQHRDKPAANGSKKRLPMKRRMTLANALQGAQKSKKKAGRIAQIMGMITKLVAVKSGGMQLVNHLLMFISVLMLLLFAMWHQPRNQTVHASALATARLRSLLTPAARDGSFAALRALVSLIDETRTQPREFAFAVASPVLLRHVSARHNPDNNNNNKPIITSGAGTCSLHGRFSVPPFGETAFDGLVSKYHPQLTGEAIELGRLGFASLDGGPVRLGVTASNLTEDSVSMPILGAFDAAEAFATLDRLAADGWLVPGESSALFADVLLRYPPTIGGGNAMIAPEFRDDLKPLVALRLLFEVAPGSGLQSMSVRAWSLTFPQVGWRAGVVICAVVVGLTTTIQIAYERAEWRRIGWRAYKSDFWNYTEVLLIAFNLFVLVSAAYFCARLYPLLDHDSLAAVCTERLQSAARACPQLASAAALSICRTQLGWGLAELLHDASQWLAIILALAIVHWIKYFELIPHLALPIHTLTATALDLLSLFVVVFLLLICFAVIMLAWLGPSSANFASFGDALLSALLLTLGNIEYLDLLFREGPNALYEQSSKPAFVLFIFFHWSVVLILLSLVIAALTAGYENAKIQVRER